MQAYSMLVEFSDKSIGVYNSATLNLAGKLYSYLAEKGVKKIFFMKANLADSANLASTADPRDDIRNFSGLETILYKVFRHAKNDDGQELDKGVSNPSPCQPSPSTRPEKG